MNKKELINKIISYVKADGKKLDKEGFIITIISPDVKCTLVKHFQPLLNYVLTNYFDYFEGRVHYIEELYEDVLLTLIKYFDNKINNKTTYKFSFLELDIIENCIKEENK
jgi:hypothetical protein